VAKLTIQNLDEGLKERLRVRAAEHGLSIEEEALAILKQAVGGVSGAALWSLSRQLFADDKSVELLPAPRDLDRAPPHLGGERNLI
jgi:plasmid stability protein